MVCDWIVTTQKIKKKQKKKRTWVSYNVLTSDVGSILKNKSCTKDDDSYMLGEEDETLEEYIKEEVLESEEDDDINNGGDIQDISSDDE